MLLLLLLGLLYVVCFKLYVYQSDYIQINSISVQSFDVFLNQKYDCTKYNIDILRFKQLKMGTYVDFMRIEISWMRHVSIKHDNEIEEQAQYLAKARRLPSQPRENKARYIACTHCVLPSFNVCFHLKLLNKFPFNTVESRLSGSRWTDVLVIWRTTWSSACWIIEVPL